MREITSLQHPLVKHLIKLRQNRDYRYEHGSLFIEGIKPINEGQTLSVKCLLSWNETLVPKHIFAEESYIVSEAVMKKISGMQSPEGLVAEIVMPKPSSLVNLNYIVAFDGVADPGNMGTLMRTALALGWEGIYILENSCDPFNEKALRASRGATFRLPLAWGNWQQLEDIIQQNHLTPIVANLEGALLETITKKEAILLVLGNESKGVSEMAKERCQAVKIPMGGKMESLNVSVAGGIMMYALRYQTRIKS